MATALAHRLGDSDEQTIRESLDAMGSGIAIYDADLRLVMANSKFLELRNLPSHFAAPGSSFADQIRFRVQRGDYGDADPETVVAEYIELVRRDEPHRIELHQPDGSWLAIRGNPLPGGGFISIYADITKAKRAEAAQRERERDLQRMFSDSDESRHRFEAQAAAMAELAETVAMEKERAESAARAKSEFLANASHELRTPLTSIIGFSHLARKKLAGEATPEEIDELVGYVLESGEHLLSLINDLLDVSKIESGKDELNEETFAVSGLVESAVTLVRQRADEGNIVFENSIDEGVSGLFADNRKTKQILVNLLSNAIKFTPDGGRVSLSVAQDGQGGLAFCVADTGIGMAPGDIAKAFSVFGQIDSDQGRKHVGTGLGLPLSKSLAELHAGTLDVESAPGRGTSITLRFPAARTAII